MVNAFVLESNLHLLRLLLSLKILVLSPNAEASIRIRSPSAALKSLMISTSNRGEKQNSSALEPPRKVSVPAPPVSVSSLSPPESASLPPPPLKSLFRRLLVIPFTFSHSSTHARNPGARRLFPNSDRAGATWLVSYWALYDQFSSQATFHLGDA